ncbi:hypothetical protein DCO48_13535 [Pseudomonas sp. SDI]|uniref:hypothetical protein n=1 Tax=Pseudomonas sp. SDI TaxID=2170734 RepID=UPI000DE6BBD0|nr:hypothetical protein [Pseudomonas sp. SDI]PWB32356.1 hypothetical protein DCO48_13535 [Pseudomonas sp. SDI]
MDTTTKAKENCPTCGNAFAEAPSADGVISVPCASCKTQPMNYAAELKRMQEASAKRVARADAKVAERMSKLQLRFANIRKSAE